jgi:hypothetical protein
MNTDYKNRTAIILKGDIEQGDSALWMKWFLYSDNLVETLGLPSTHYGINGEDFKKVTGIRTAKRFKKKIQKSISENHSIDYLEIYHYFDK